MPLLYATPKAPLVPFLLVLDPALITTRTLPAAACGGACHLYHRDSPNPLRSCRLPLKLNLHFTGLYFHFRDTTKHNPPVSVLETVLISLHGFQSDCGELRAFCQYLIWSGVEPANSVATSQKYFISSAVGSRPVCPSAIIRRALEKSFSAVAGAVSDPSPLKL